MPYRANYPESVQEVLRDNQKYNPNALRALKRFRRSKPWRGTLTERQGKFNTLHNDLCAVYGLSTALNFNTSETNSGSSHFVPARNSITLCGRLSVVTYLHEFGHARGWDERYSCIWSINLFRRIFPRSFERCEFDGHMVMNNNRLN